MSALRRFFVVVAGVLCAGVVGVGSSSSSPPAWWDEVEPPVRSCSLAELAALGIDLRVRTYDGWFAVVEFRAAMRRACRKVPRYWQLANRDFGRSTRIVDRLFPGVGSWASTCASSEGGHGAWVPNRGGSGAGGWMQFMSSTFWSVIDGAFARARGLGVRLPGYARSWYSPIGQAFAAAEMIFDGRRGEWTGSTC